VSAEVRLPTLLRPMANGQAQVSIDPGTLREVLGQLVEKYPGLDGQIIDEEGKLRRFVNLYVNDDDVRYLDELDTKVSDGDVVTILPAVAGGAGEPTVKSFGGQSSWPKGWHGNHGK
jgi:molybdopterin synthase sulfur carrier subunit